MKRILWFAWLGACTGAPPPKAAPASGTVPEMLSEAPLAASLPAAGPADSRSCDNEVTEGIMAERKRQPDVALERYQHAISKDRFCGAAYGAQAMLLLRAGQPAKAEQLLRDGLTASPNNVPARVSYATLLAYVGRLPEAEKQALEVLHADEKNTGAMLVLARVYYGQRKYELSRFAAESARESDGASAEAYHQLGVLSLQKNERPQALVAFRKAIELRPDMAAAQINLSELLSEGGDFDGALGASEQALAFLPDSVAAHLTHANALRGVQRFRDAQTEYEWILAKDANNRAAAYDLGILFLDAEIPGMELDARLRKAVQALADYVARFKPSSDETAQVNGYIAGAKRQIEAEEKRKDREAKRAAKAASQPASQAVSKQAVSKQAGSQPVAKVPPLPLAKQPASQPVSKQAASQPASKPTAVQPTAKPMPSPTKSGRAPRKRRASKTK